MRAGFSAFEEFIDAGDRMVVRVHQSGRGEASGAMTTSEYWFVFTVGEAGVVQLDM